MEEEIKLGKSVSDVSEEMKKYYKIEEKEEVKEVECECCGMKEECTEGYIREVEACFCGEWVCGLCSAAVKERVLGGRGVCNINMRDALTSHRDFCRHYNSTTRLNPKLSLTLSMRDIVNKSSRNRNTNTTSSSKLPRTISYP